MADPVTLSAGISWGLSAAGWLISPVVSRLVNKCFDALDGERKFQSRKNALTKKLDDLQTRLLPQLIILTDAAQRSPYRGELEAWLQKLRSAYYEAEHLLGLVEYTQLEKKANSSFPIKSTFNLNFKFWEKFNFWELKFRKENLLKGLENLEKLIIDETSKLAPILDLSTNNFNKSIPTEQPNEQRNETISASSFEVIGRDKDRDNIVQLLLKDFPYCTKCYSVVGLWGMGGSGKTTLAQYIKKDVEDNHLNIKDVKVNGFFDLVAWVHVSQNFNVKSILEGIWESAFKEPCPNFKTIEGLQSKLQEKLKGQRFFVVLDDAWCDKDVSEKQFQQLFAPLQDAKRGSKILVTTRIEEAAKALGARKLIPLRQLHHDEFLELFLRHALPDFVDAEKHLEETLKQIGEQIVEKLHGSPLAATTVAGQLRKRLDPDFWLSMSEQNLLEGTMGALLLSYQNLPPPLQRCFAFCSLFPKGHKFSQDHLVSLWIGEGFIETEDSNRHVRDIGNEYILELISSSFLQVDGNGWNDKEIYSVHDLLHDLAEQVSKGDCFRIECNEKRDIPTQTRHLYVDVRMFEEYIEKICKLKDLRTIIFGPWGTLMEEDLNALFKTSKKLYVVDFYDCDMDGWPEYVLTLKNLRYLNDGVPRLTKFSKPSTGLYQLRLLHSKYRRGYSNIEIPNVGRLTLLQDLTMFSVRDVRGCGLEQLEHLRDLYGELVICNLKNVKNSQEACRVKLFDKKGLRALALRWTPPIDIDSSVSDSCNSNEIEDDEDILDALCPPPQLEKLSISFYRGKRCPKWFSGYNKNATHLKELHLVNCPFLEALPETNKLIHLQSLTISHLPRLKKWAPVPSSLVDLKINECNSLAFLAEEDLKIRMSTRSGEPSPIDKELEKLVPDNLYDMYLKRQKELDHICQLKEVNGELYLPLKLQKLVMFSCFISDQILANSLKGHTSLTHLELCNIIPITCIPREVLCSLINLRVLRIKRCLTLTSVGGLEHLSSLEELEITDCPCLVIEMPVVARGSSLKKVTLIHCQPRDNMFQALNSIETLKIGNCPTIKCLDFSNSKSLQTLEISECPVIQALNFSNLKSLKTTGIRHCPAIQALDFSNLMSLQTLKIDECLAIQALEFSNSRLLSSLSLLRCTNLVSLRGLNELNNLQNFNLNGCDKLQCSSDANKLPGLRQNHFTVNKLSMLELISRDGLSSLVSLTIQESEQEYITPEECEILSHLSSLEKIQFHHCKMQSLPDLSCLKALTTLQIFLCKDLISLSELPPSVQHISITYCNAEFVRSCKDSNHPNCQKISHIPQKHISEGLLPRSSLKIQKV